MYPTPIHRTSRAGFTLVELIVVITILAILGTIGFVSFQGYTSDARNTKRTQDLSSIATALANKKAAQSVSISTYSTPVTNSAVPAFAAGTGLSIGGFEATQAVAGTAYGAGDVNYTAMGLVQKDFQDPNGQNYKIGWTILNGNAYEIAATLEGDTPKAAVKGTYMPRLTDTTFPSAAPTFSPTPPVSTTSSFNVILASADTSGVNLHVGDYITLAAGTVVTNATAGATSPTITKISSDQKLITVNATVGATTIGVPAVNAWAIQAEMGGLVTNRLNTTAAPACASGNVPVTDGSTTCLPY